MAKLFSSSSEVMALKGMCSKDPKVSGLLIGSLKEDYFYNEEAKEIYSFLMASFDKKGEVPPYQILRDSIKITSEAREFLEAAGKIAVVSSIEGANHLVAQLDDLRKTRGLYAIAAGLLKSLERSSVDPVKLLSSVADKLTTLSTRRTTESDIYHLGVESNSRPLVEEMLYGENADSCIPTGLKTFDARNGGFFRGSLVVLSANSGGGKSLLANQLCMNQARLGYKVLKVPLEMTAEEDYARMMANLSGVNPTDILLKRLASGERDLVWKKIRKFEREVAHNNGRFTIFKPKEDITMQSLMSAIHSYNADIIYIDYIGLLAGADGDDQWRKLGQIARFAKIYADAHNKPVVLLCQLSDDGKIRYSQAIKEHASLAWTWTATKDTREKGFLNVELLKARNQDMSPFTLKVDYAHMRVSDLDPSELEILRQESARKSAQTGSKPGSEFKPKNKVDLDAESDFLPDQST